jgi:hypothetical protein
MPIQSLILTAILIYPIIMVPLKGPRRVAQLLRTARRMVKYRVESQGMLRGFGTPLVGRADTFFNILND